MPWHHPDDLDRQSASRDPSRTEPPASPEEVAAVLRKVLITGRLQRIPRNPRHRSVLLAALCLQLRRRYPYSEPELNEQLKEALAALPAVVDYVTLRRYLVDLGFLRRDRAGRRYLLDYRRVAATLGPEAIAAYSDAAALNNR
ncbi:MAG TPA: DUF2087 domain-containing protein [Pseudomonadales bacterium]